MKVCREKIGTKHCIVIRRTNLRTTFIVYEKKCYQVVIKSNEWFDGNYRIIDHHPAVAAETWAKSTLKMTKKVREELEMIVAVSKRKIIAVLEDGSEAPENAVDVFTSAEDLAGKDVKELLRLRNMTRTKEDKLKSFEEGDNPAELTFNDMVEYEVPAKAEPKKREVLSVNIKDNTLFTALENKQNRAGSVRTSVYNKLAELGESTAAELAEACEMEVKEVKGYLRPLCADGKVQAFTPEVEENEEDAA